MSIEAMKLALEALESVTGHFTRTPSTLRDSEVRGEAHNAITALRQAIADAEQAQPVAWNVIDPSGKVVATESNAIRGWARISGYKPTVEGLLGFHEQGWRVIPVAPPQRQPLTDDEIIQIVNANSSKGLYLMAKAIEAKLKQKNGFSEENT